MDQSAQSSGVHLQRALLAHGWAEDVRVVIADGRIAAVSQGVPAHADDERAAVGVPGLPNVHSHAFQRAMAGLTEYRDPAQEQDTFWTWRELMYRFLAHMSPDDVEAVSAQAYVEMLEAGFTRVGEFHYLHRDPAGQLYSNPAELSERIVAAAQATGIGLTLLPVFYAHGGFGGAAPTVGQRRFVCSLEEFARLFEACRALVSRAPLARLGIAPHSLRAVTPEELRELIPLAGAGPIHIHAAEQVREVEDCVAWSGLRPVEWLLEYAPVDRRYCLIHATHLTGAEVQRLGDSGAVAGLCPVTEANLGDGVFPATAYLAAGGRFGIGTDSNVWISAPGELRMLEYTQRLTQRARNLIADVPRSTGRVLFDAALSGGAQALGAASGIEVGASADLVSLKMDEPALFARTADQILDSWIFAAGSGCVDSVWCAGVKLVEHGRHRQRESISARYREVLTRLLRA
ncbi:MAG TPA: formimidoylglutamate deiminase [Polyangiales bacterium]|nr:formimidoylglutamate deiminase [Polyangiales bacterium]